MNCILSGCSTDAQLMLNSIQKLVSTVADFMTWHHAAGSLRDVKLMLFPLIQWAIKFNN